MRRTLKVNYIGKQYYLTAVYPDLDSMFYRDHDELRHSFRSVLTHFRPYIRQFHLFTSDFSFSPDKYTSSNSSSPSTQPASNTNNTHTITPRDPSPSHLPTSPNYTHIIPPYIPNASNRLRLGQVPNWLSTEEEGEWRDGEVGLAMVYHSQVFEGWEGTSFNR
jgi:hypothetical protein